MITVLFKMVFSVAFDIASTVDHATV